MSSPQDPLSALDAHVGKAVFQNVLQNSLSGKTRILVTHALHFLPQVDYIYVISEGHIAEFGTYSELMSHGKDFSRFVTEFGSKEEEEKKDVAVVDKDAKKKEEGMKKAVGGAGMMQAEERNTGAISWHVYKTYLSAGRAEVVLPLLLFSLILIQGATVMASYWFVSSSVGGSVVTNNFYLGWSTGRNGNINFSG
jgi:ABC-type Fe3+/spermidine/putrescine transport system ATPase subunit